MRTVIPIRGLLLAVALCAIGVAPALAGSMHDVGATIAEGQVLDGSAGDCSYSGQQAVQGIGHPDAAAATTNSNVAAGIGDSSGETGSPRLQQVVAYEPMLGTMLSQINEAEIYRSVADLQNISTRVYPSPGNTQAATYLYTRLTAIPGLHVEYQGDDYHNVIASLPGTNPASGSVVVVGAHYDSISTDSDTAPGATDNGGGVAIVLELARVMSTYHFNKTIQFAFWNADESGLQGSAAYVTAAVDNARVIPLYFNFDSSCYDPENQYVIDLMYNEGAKPLADSLMRYNSLYGINFTLTSNVHTCTSDHVSFWQGGYPAIMTHAASHAPQAHTHQDTIDLVSTSYAKKNAQLGMALLADTAEMPPAAAVSSGSVPGTDVTTSPVVVSPISAPVTVPTVTSTLSPSTKFGARRYVVGAVPKNPPTGISGGTSGATSISRGKTTLGTGVGTGTTPPSSRFIRWSPVTRWRSGHTS